MRNGSSASLLPPPARLRPLPGSWVRILRPLWMLLFGFALLADVAATVYVLRDTYEVQPVFYRVGLDYEVQYRGEVWVGTIPDEQGKQAVPVRSRIVGIDGKSVDPLQWLKPQR